MTERQRELLKKIIIIAIPIAIQNLINVGVSVTDTLMIGNISEIQLAGISQANQPYFIFTTLIFGLASGSMVLNAQYWGQRDTGAIKTIMGLMMRIGIIGGLLASVVVLIFPEQAVAIFTNEAEVINYGAQYLSIVGLSYVFSAFTGIYLMGLRSIQNVKISMYIYGLSFILNVFLNYTLIFGKFGMPRLECRGAAIATLISRIFESILVLIYMYKIEDKVKFRVKDIFRKFGMPRLECRGAAIATLISRIFESILVLIYMYKIEDKVKFRVKDIFRKTSKYWKSIATYSLPVLLSEINWGLGISMQAAIIGSYQYY